MSRRVRKLELVEDSSTAVWQQSSQDTRLPEGQADVLAQLRQAERRIAELEEDAFTLKAELLCKAAEEKHGKSQLIDALKSQLQFKQRELEESDQALRSERALRHQETAKKRSRQERSSPQKLEQQQQQQQQPTQAVPTETRVGARTVDVSKGDIPQWISGQDLVNVVQMIDPNNTRALVDGSLETVLLSEVAIRLENASPTIDESHLLSPKPLKLMETDVLDSLLRVLKSCFLRQSISLDHQLVSKLFLPLLERSLTVSQQDSVAGSSGISTGSTTAATSSLIETDTPRKRIHSNSSAAAFVTPNKVRRTEVIGSPSTPHMQNAIFTTTSGLDPQQRPPQQQQTSQSPSLTNLYHIRPALLEVLAIFSRNTTRECPSGQRLCFFLFRLFGLIDDSVVIGSPSLKKSSSFGPADENCIQQSSVSILHQRKKASRFSQDFQNFDAEENRHLALLELLALVSSTQSTGIENTLCISSLFKDHSDESNTTWNSMALHVVLSIFLSNPDAIVRSSDVHFITTLHRLSRTIPKAGVLAEALSKHFSSF